MEKGLRNEFVVYPLALRMKALGYNEPCFGYYIGLGDNKEKPFKFLEEKTEKGQFELIDNVCQAPTWQSAFEWLLETHLVYGIVIPTITTYWTFKTMTYAKGMIEVPPYKNVDAYDYSERHEAQQVCLEKLIEIVEKRKEDGSARK